MEARWNTICSGLGGLVAQNVDSLAKVKGTGMMGLMDSCGARAILVAVDKLEKLKNAANVTPDDEKPEYDSDSEYRKPWMKVKGNQITTAEEVSNYTVPSVVLNKVTSSDRKRKQPSPNSYRKTPFGANSVKGIAEGLKKAKKIAQETDPESKKEALIAAAKQHLRGKKAENDIHHLEKKLQRKLKKRDVSSSGNRDGSKKKHRDQRKSGGGVARKTRK